MCTKLMPQITRMSSIRRSSPAWRILRVKTTSSKFRAWQILPPGSGFPRNLSEALSVNGCEDLTLLRTLQLGPKFCCRWKPNVGTRIFIFWRVSFFWYATFHRSSAFLYAFDTKKQKTKTTCAVKCSRSVCNYGIHTSTAFLLAQSWVNKWCRNLWFIEIWDQYFFSRRTITFYQVHR